MKKINKEAIVEPETEKRTDTGVIMIETRRSRRIEKLSGKEKPKRPWWEVQGTAYERTNGIEINENPKTTYNKKRQKPEIPNNEQNMFEGRKRQDRDRRSQNIINRDILSTKEGHETMTCPDVVIMDDSVEKTNNNSTDYSKN